EDLILLWPSMNPDGQQMVGEWNAKNAGTPYAQAELPVLYQEYVGHDNNRDGYMLNMIESRLMENFWRQWEPNIIYVHHQTSPFPTRIWLPPFADPVGFQAPRIPSREVNMIGMAIAKGLEERGQTGATHMGAFDAWYPGYIDYAPMYKNIPAFWTETAGSQAVPRETPVEKFPPAYRDLRPQSLYLSPWPGGWWRLGDAVAYNETASLAVLEYAAKYKSSLLFNRYQSGRDQIARGRRQAPYAYVVSSEQRDPVAAVELLRRLAFGGVRVHQLAAPGVFDGIEYPAGCWVIPLDQEFAALARELLDIQKYPDLRDYPGGPPSRPYDATGWTLPLQMGVRWAAVLTLLDDNVRAKMILLGPNPVLSAPFVPYNMTETSDRAVFDSVPGIGFDADPAAAAIVPPPGKISGKGPALLVDPAQNNAYRAINRAWKKGATVRFEAAATGGRFAISGLSKSDQNEMVQALALSAERSAAKGDLLKKPRLGIFQPWGGSMDEGWTRWLLERFEFEYVILRPEDFQKPLGSRVDVVILPSDARIPVEPPAGGDTQAAPAEQRGPDHPAPVVRPEHSYALKAGDLKLFEEFIRGGGTLVCFDGSTPFAVRQFNLPVKNAIDGLKREECFIGGSILEAIVDPAQRLMAGMPEKTAIFSDRSPVFETLEGFKGSVLARYAPDGSPLLSGLLIGEKYLQGRAAALDVELGKGHVVLFGFCPQWRAQSFGTFRLVFNAAIFGR
ncbi:MAG: M14 family metallopeptidase, partial [Candidatus Aminicenantales bacterium]